MASITATKSIVLSTESAIEIIVQSTNQNRLFLFLKLPLASGPYLSTNFPTVALNRIRMLPRVLGARAVSTRGIKKCFASSYVNFDWSDPLNLSSLLTEEEKIVQETARSYAQVHEFDSFMI